MSEIGWNPRHEPWRCDPREAQEARAAAEEYVVGSLQEESRFPRGVPRDAAWDAALEAPDVMDGLARLEAVARDEAARALCEAGVLARARQASFLVGVREAVLLGPSDARVRVRASRNAAYREGVRRVERMSAEDRAALRAVFEKADAERRNRADVTRPR